MQNLQVRVFWFLFLVQVVLTSVGLRLQQSMWGAKDKNILAKKQSQNSLTNDDLAFSVLFDKGICIHVQITVDRDMSFSSFLQITSFYPFFGYLLATLQA